MFWCSGVDLKEWTGAGRFRETDRLFLSVSTGVLVGAPIWAAVTMVALSLKICVRQCNVVKTMQFEPSTPVYDACRIIRERVPEAQAGQGKSCRIFL